jgi:AcrR family transcriptional regulator
VTLTQKRRTRLSKDARREQILTAAILIIGENGFDNFALKDLADRCGMSDAGLLHHFGTKEGLLIALLAERDRQDETAITSEVERKALATPKTREEVLGVLRMIMARTSERPELTRLYTLLRTEALRLGHPARDFFTRRDTATKALIAGMVAPYVADPEMTARAIVAAMNGLGQQWLSEDQSFNLAAAWDSIATGLLN